MGGSMVQGCWTCMRGYLSRHGVVLAHAVAEPIFGRLKRGLTAHCQYATRQEARDDIMDDLEIFYNSTRKHSYLEYVSPNDYEALYHSA